MSQRPSSADRARRLAVVLTRGEARRVLSEMSEALRPIVLMLYGSGLRLLEALRLRVREGILIPI
ncbi:MAG: hypothetical protein RBS80_31545 [Thermoguttaceae bacterium]|jgi:integrase|nr:hypothetical protein [Thermoguttaceae bacterium]